MGLTTMWAPRGTACTPQSTHQVEAPAPVKSSFVESRKSFDSDDAGSHCERKSDESDSDLEVSYQCPCGRRFTRSVAYHRHLDVAHSNAECHKCTECGKTFGNERTLTMHMSVHQDSKQFTSTIERCSQSRSSQKAHKTNGSNISHVVANINTIRAHVDKMSNGLAQTVHSITSNSGSHTCNPSTEELSDSSQNCSKESHYSLSSGEESAGTDKENYSPKHDSDIITDQVNNTDLSCADAIPPLINGSYHVKTGFELDHSFPKSKTKAGSNEAITVSGDAKTITTTDLVSCFGGVNGRSSTEGSNKVSIITIKSDRSLLSDSLVFHTKNGKTGDFIVTPGSHSVIVIKTQDAKNKLNGTTVRLEPVNLKDIPRDRNVTTCLSDDANLVRKSQRLQGKIPGWKHILDPSEISDQKFKRRKMAKVKIEDLTNGYKMKEDTPDEYILSRNRDHVAIEDIGFCDIAKGARLANPSKESCGSVKSECFKCPVCERSFASEKYLSMHMSLHKVDNSMESLMQQNSKDEELEDLNAKAIKTATANANGAFWTCKICNKVFAQNSNYKNHIRTHSDERPFVCQICSIGFKERYHLKKHMLFKHSDELKEECRYCGKKFKDSTAVRAHERIHSDVRPYSCRRCGKSFKTSECLWHHENRSKTCGQALLGLPAPSPRFKRGRQPKKEIKTAPGGITVIPVNTNGQQFIPGTSLLISDASHVMNSNMTTLPHYTYSEVAAATASIQSPNPQHLVPVSTMGEPQLVRVHCNPIVATTAAAHTQEVVSMAYAKASSPLITATTNAVQTQTLQTFSTAHGISSPVMVKVEPESALSDYELTAMTSSDGSFGDNHADVLMDEDPSLPSVAMIESIESESGIAEFSHETILQLEEEIKKDPVLEDIEMSLLEKSAGDEDLNMEDEDAMDDEDDFDDIEEYLYSQGHATKKSSDSHYTCDKCGKNFVSVSAFDKHLLTHSGLRPYLCPVCNVGFKLKVHLKKHHLYRHSDEKPCECSICGKKFKDSSAVRLHERIHSTDRPFHCECGKTFKTRENLWGHRHRGPCEKKPRYPEVLSPLSDTSLHNVSSPTVDMINVHTNGAIHAHAQLRDTHVSAHAAINNNQSISQTVKANDLNDEAMLDNGGHLKASVSVSEQIVEVVDVAVTTAGNIIKSNTESMIAKLPEQPPVSVVMTPRTDITPVIFARSLESRVSLPVLSALAPSAGVPTAVVAPLKREVAAVSLSGVAIPSTSILKPIKHSVQVEVPKPLAPKPIAVPSDKTDTSLPPFETFSPTLRSKGPTLADRCPTIQRYLQMARQPVKLPGIQQLFQSHSMAHGLRATGLAPHVAMSHSLLPMRCPDPSAPLGPHPVHSVNSPPPSSPRLMHSPAPQGPYPCLSGPKNSCPGQIFVTTTPASSPIHHLASLPAQTNPTTLLPTSVYLPQTRMTAVKHDNRSTSPYPGALPLLLPIDPNMASTSGEAITAQSPADSSIISIAQTLPTVAWEDDKKVVHSNMWHTEQEQLFQDLTQTTAFGPL